MLDSGDYPVKNSIMCCSKIMTARVALGLGSQAEVDQVLAHATYCNGCKKGISEVAHAASAVAGPYCLSGEEILRSTEMAVGEEDEEHLHRCARCSLIGFKIVQFAPSGRYAEVLN